ncbi:unnamed protein product [Peronospora belbahrii]|uniref:Uncharacterized protein n=1 Tax=Peronospora belbahrii TaxID=622444 RepID=A0AAU9L1V1_9STRA|nr:unnamed protein product [Peronospora belbahrii]
MAFIAGKGDRVWMLKEVEANVAATRKGRFSGIQRSYWAVSYTDAHTQLTRRKRCGSKEIATTGRKTVGRSFGVGMAFIAGKGDRVWMLKEVEANVAATRKGRFSGIQRSYWAVSYTDAHTQLTRRKRCGSKEIVTTGRKTVGRSFGVGMAFIAGKGDRVWMLKEVEANVAATRKGRFSGIQRSYWAVSYTDAHTQLTRRKRCGSKEIATTGRKTVGRSFGVGMAFIAGKGDRVWMLKEVEANVAATRKGRFSGIQRSYWAVSYTDAHTQLTRRKRCGSKEIATTGRKTVGRSFGVGMAFIAGKGDRVWMLKEVEANVDETVFSVFEEANTSYSEVVASKRTKISFGVGMAFIAGKGDRVWMLKEVEANVAATRKGRFSGIQRSYWAVSYTDAHTQLTRRKRCGSKEIATTGRKTVGRSFGVGMAFIAGKGDRVWMLKEVEANVSSSG